MRRLKTTDVFAAMRVIKAAGIKDEVKRIALEASESKKDINVREVGAELILSIFEGLAEKKAEQMAYEFLAGPLEMSPNTIGELSIADLIEKIKALGKLEDAEGWKNFFASLGDLIK